MMTPAIVEVAQLPPGTCMICGCNSGPMIDTMVGLPPYGRMYICIDRCIPMLAEQNGYASPKQIAALAKELDQLAAEIASLRVDLTCEKNNKVISLDDFRKYAQPEVTALPINVVR